MGVLSKKDKSNGLSPKLIRNKSKENMLRKPLSKFTENIGKEGNTFLVRSKMAKKEPMENMDVIRKKKGTELSKKWDLKDVVRKAKKKSKEVELVTNYTKSKKGTKNNENLIDEIAMESRANLRTHANTDNNILNKKLVKKRKRVESENENNDEAENGLRKLSKSHILQCISAIFHLKEEQLNKKNLMLLDEAKPIFMQVTCMRIPKVPRRQMRILLPHSVVSKDDDVALFVCDLERGRRKDYEKTVDHYKELLEKCGCTRIKDIIPMNQVKTEYDQYELKRKLVARYDYFLTDGRIAGHMCHLLGKTFLKKRKLPTSIKMDKDNLKDEIDKALRKTCMNIHSLSDTHVVQIGHTSMKKKHILENIITVCKFLSKNYPGGWSNIRALRLKTPQGVALPIYITLKNKNNVEVPEVKPKRPKAYQTVEGELSTVSGNVKVTVAPEGDVTVKRITKSKQT